MGAACYENLLPSIRSSDHHLLFWKLHGSMHKKLPVFNWSLINSIFVFIHSELHVPLTALPFVFITGIGFLERPENFSIHMTVLGHKIGHQMNWSGFCLACNSEWSSDIHQHSAHQCQDYFVTLNANSNRKFWPWFHCLFFEGVPDLWWLWYPGNNI